MEPLLILQKESGGTSTFLPSGLLDRFSDSQQKQFVLICVLFIAQGGAGVAIQELHLCVRGQRRRHLDLVSAL